MNEAAKRTHLKTGFISSLALTALTVLGFAFAMTAIPPSGPYCPGDCMTYPFLNLLDYYPRDYLWMYVISFQLIVFLIFVISNHFNAPEHKKMFSFISVNFALLTTAVLLVDYFIQYTVIPISMMKGQTDGIALLTQYNGYGIFIALEELGFILMSLSFLFLSPLFSNRTRLEKTLKWLYAAPAPLIFLSFVYYAVQYGLDRSYRFEVAAITVDWLATIIIGILSTIYFQRRLKEPNQAK